MTNLTYKMNPMPTPIAQDKLDRLAKLETATIGHFYHFGFAAPAIQPAIQVAAPPQPAATLYLQVPPHASMRSLRLLT